MNRTEPKPTSPPAPPGHPRALRSGALGLALLGVALMGCPGGGVCDPANSASCGTSWSNHSWFPVTPTVSIPPGVTVSNPHTGGRLTEFDGPVACASCHVDADAGTPSASFTDYSCTAACHNSHPRVVTDLLHTSVAPTATWPAGYEFGKCLACHPFGTRINSGFDHQGVTQGCQTCHSAGNVYHRLTVAGSGALIIDADGGVHTDIGSGASLTDCSGCHGSTTSWSDVSGGGAQDKSDPANDVLVTGSVPSFTGTVMDSVTALDQTLPMKMVHGSTYTTCTTCHQGGGNLFPGVFHASLAASAQPRTCNTCHLGALPLGFVGSAPTAFPRTPATGEMKHDAVAWTSGPTSGRLPLPDCGVCHTAPSATQTSDWVLGRGAVGVTQYHSALADAGVAQPTQCLDCHANTRPTARLTSLNSTLPAGMEFDHTTPAMLGECASCHAASAVPPVTTWAKGVFHAAGSANPTTCLPCHAAERPTSTTTWKSTTYQRSPFDYVTNLLGVTHGNGLDCAVCHSGPGTGAWGSTQNFQGGKFHLTANAPYLAAGCVNCHSSQRPDRLGVSPSLLAPANGGVAFDHAKDGAADCGGCHGATVAAGRFLDLWLNGTTTPTIGGDWKGGKAYPGNFLVASTDQYIDLTEWQLVKASPTSPLFTQTPIKVTDRRYNGMLHTSAQIDGSKFGIYADGGTPDSAQCWHCHTHDSTGTVTAFSNGVYHQALTSYSTSPASITGPPVPQPTSGCADCHSQMLPPNIVMRDAGVGGLAELRPMDHSAQFKAAVTLGGKSVTAVSQADCSVCHESTAGTSWADGVFHANIGAAQPKDCVSCHLLLMTKTASANVTYKLTGGTYNLLMDHWSPALPFQSCETCHTAALAKATAATPLATLWGPSSSSTDRGKLHAVIGTQPGACVRCHTVSTPASLTQSTETYVFAQGGTATNGGAWMTHGATTVSTQDCVLCHAADADPTPAWSRGPPGAAFHANVPTVTTCNGCHGVAGANNNLPSGLNDSTTVTTSSVAATPKPFDQIAHTDLNVTSHECGFCHTQAGPSTVTGTAGKEWTKATFHRNFSGTGTSALVMNGTTGRCSNCHLNVKPGTGQTTQNHSSYTAASGSTDCSQCHNWPGTGTATAPNWLGATGAHASSGSTATSQTLDCNGCHGLNGQSQTHLSVDASQHYGGITNGNSCISCHRDFSGFSGTTLNLLYAHTNATANSGGCGTCHKYVSGVYTTLTTTPALSHPITAGGHTFSQSTLVSGKNGNKSSPAITNQPHTNTKFTLCGTCHQYASTTATTNIWTFKHEPSNPGISRSWTSTNGCSACHNSNPN